jgi:hypothetical protein
VFGRVKSPARPLAARLVGIPVLRHKKMNPSCLI